MGFTSTSIYQLPKIHGWLKPAVWHSDQRTMLAAHQSVLLVAYLVLT